MAPKGYRFMIKLPTPTQFAGAFFKRLSRIACSSLMLLALAAPLPAVDILYVSMDDSTIVSFDTTGNNGSTIAATKAVFTSTNLSLPQGLAFDSTGNLYAANVGDDTISKFNSSGAYLSNITTNLNGPIGLAFDSTGNLYAANLYNSTISKFNSSGAYLSNITTNLNGPIDLAFDSSDNLYAANYNNNSISKFDSAGTFLSQINSNLSNPAGLAFDSSGNLYAANYNNNSISKFNSAGTFLTSWSTGSAIPNYLAFKPVTVPEPSTYALATIATGVMAYLARRRKARTA
jgi:sugar lactone lactonase YvrE